VILVFFDDALERFELEGLEAIAAKAALRLDGDAGVLDRREAMQLVARSLLRQNMSSRLRQRVVEFGRFAVTSVGQIDWRSVCLW